MIPRKKLDIGWRDLLFGLRCCLRPAEREQIQRQIEEYWSPGRSATCLSVRSGFDLLWKVLNLPPGSEVLMSAVTIRDMARIVESHGLVPVPVDLNIDTLAIREESLLNAISPRSKALVAAHLFGTRMPLDSVVQIARQHGLLVIEDCAQAYTGPDFRGNAATDVSMFSFGPIKTATALGGGIFRFRDADLCRQFQQAQEDYPLQSVREFRRRLTKYLCLKLLTYRSVYTGFVGCLRMRGVDHDRFISESVRGFAPGDFLQRIRQRPCAPLLSLINRRIRRYSTASIDARADIARKVLRGLAPGCTPGEAADLHTYWVFPIRCAEPDRLVRQLQNLGFDATRGTSSLCALPPPDSRPETRAAQAEQAMQQIVYLPVYPGLRARDLRRLAEAMCTVEAPRRLQPDLASDSVRV
jgi:perosamine synthetase